MKKIARFGWLSLALIVGLCASAVQAQTATVTGDWQGALNAGGVTLHLVLHLQAGADGTLAGTLDSIDQGAKGIPITKAELKDGKLTLELDSIRGRFVGTMSSSGTEIAGDWTQSSTLPLTFHRMDQHAQATLKRARPTPYDGDWTGVLAVGGQQLHLVIHIANMEDGLHAALDSIDQGATAIPASSAAVDAAGIKVAFAALDARIEGRIGASPDTMDCTFTQRGMSFPLPLTRTNTGK